MSYGDCVERDAIGAMRDMTALLNVYEWVHVSENDQRWLTVMKHFWNSQDTPEEVIRKAGREGIRLVHENTLFGKYLVFFRDTADYRVVQRQLLDRLEELEKNAAFLGEAAASEYRQDECCCCEEPPLGWRIKLLLFFVAIFIAAAIGFVFFY